MKSYFIGGHTFSNVLSMVEILDTLATAVRADQPIFHTRINDGECNCMFKLTGELAVNCDNQTYHRNLGAQLVKVFNEVCYLKQIDPTFNQILGSYLFQEPSHKGCVALTNHIANKALPYEKVTWGVGEFWYNPTSENAGAEEIILLLESVRNSKRPKVLISNQYVAEAKNCLGAEHQVIPHENCWEYTNKIMSACNEIAADGAIFIWCAGMAGKVWAWDLYKQCRNCVHLDFGHVFDGAFGLSSREWHKRKRGAHWDYCQNVFYPYIRGFIP